MVSQTAVAGPLDLQRIELPLGCLVAAVAVIVALRIAVTESQGKRIAILGFPVVVGILLLYPAVVPAGSLASDLLGWVPQACFALVILFTWQSLLLARQTAPACDAPILFCGLAVVCPFYGAGLTLIHVVGTGGRGYNHAYIARKLFVSENTVRAYTTASTLAAASRARAIHSVKPMPSP